VRGTRSGHEDFDVDNSPIHHGRIFSGASRCGGTAAVSRFVLHDMLIELPLAAPRALEMQISHAMSSRPALAPKTYPFHEGD
jgi:hypothetical protein